MSKITFEMNKKIAVLSKNEKGYTIEAHPASWNGTAAKPDIRKQHPNHEKCGRGITLATDAGQRLQEALARLYEGIDDE